MALEEIQLYEEKYTFTPDQLDAIVGLLSRGIDVVHRAIRILYNYVIERGVDPINTSELRLELRSVLSRFREDADHRPVIRQAIHLLGYYQDDAVIEQLKFDAPRFDGMASLKEEYMTLCTAKVIDDNWEDLLELQKELRKTGVERIVSALREIQKYALDNESKPIRPRDKAGISSDDNW